MNVQILKTEYPKSYAKLKEWVKSNTLKHIQQGMITGEDEKLEIPDIPELSDVELESLLLIFKRNILYDFMDANNIITTIDYTTEDGFDMHIVGSEHGSKCWNNRIAAEDAALVEAIKLLETKL